MAIGIVLIVFGSVYILRSISEEEMLLVMVAMTFVVSVDEILYSTFTPQDVKTVLQDLPPVEPPVTAGRQTFLLVWR
eukprot:CAMPEP_0175872884 /NCGR_PEP_ID=MMETSP0107_2-20121207/37987_1 /TAXON_ID=195067 ORGANISM="Goniomonas pacifica, Strain CCMP1869" /NCGR_SAMPLE_ID=MMETSP0107_2 /ASSEMBLY_ACC=CAM_ASM_000203 /LENGTH=76 /DNA_ID=CAMNT_0017191521 /DNA_START=43 /DNA_END=269 /DNA_ORIENTATION=+